MPGYDGQLGYKTETTWNTGVVVDKFPPFLSEAIKNDGGGRMVSNGIRAGRALPAKHRRGVPLIGGPVKMELGNVQIAPLLKHVFGAVATTGAGPYTHTLTPGTFTGKSMTMQVGRPDLGGTVRARTFAGVKINEATISAKTGELAQLDLTVSAASEAAGTALATASYPASWAPFSYVDGAVTIAGSSVTVDEFNITVKNTQRVDRRPVGGTTISEQKSNGMREVTISLSMDFEDLTQYTAFLADTNLTMVLSLTNGADTLTFTAKGYLTGDSPVVDSPAILKQPLNFVCESVTSDADAFTAVLVNTDTTAT